MSAYYNEINPSAAHVLRHLIAEGIIAPGDVDTRSIKEVQPDDIRGYTQCHFFAGGGLWSVAARLAGWPDERPLWTGSCPCQGESVAGKRLGAADPRHLWPDFFRLIRAARPSVVVGEQVAAAAGTHWLDGVAADLEGENYAFRAVDIPACAVDAPHIRQRLYWCALDNRQRDGQREQNATVRAGRKPADNADAQGSLGHGVGPRLEGQRGNGDERGQSGRLGTIPPGPIAKADGCNGLYADADTARRLQPKGRIGEQRGWTGDGVARRNGTHWSDAEWVICHDGKARRAKSGIRLLVDGVPGRADVWRIAGNAIVPGLAAEVIAALIDILPEWHATLLTGPAS